MPKKKTNKSVAKRFWRTARGKIKRACAAKSHLLSGKSRKRKRNLGKNRVLTSADEKRISAMI